MNTAFPEVPGSSASEEGVYLKIADTPVLSQICSSVCFEAQELAFVPPSWI